MIQIQCHKEMLASPAYTRCFSHAGSLAHQRRLVLYAGMETPHPAYCIFIDTLCEGTVPSVRTENDLPCVFATRVEAEREIADCMMIRLQQFMDGQRDFDDAITVEEYVVEVAVNSDGSIVDADGNQFGSRRVATGR